MTQFKDFDEIFDPLELPIRGKTYTIPPLSFEAGGTVNGVIAKIGKMTDEEFYRLMLSDAVFEEMLADNLPAIAIDRAARTALTDFKYARRDLALMMWETGGDDPKALESYLKRNAPNRASRRSKSTAAARKTR